MRVKPLTAVIMYRSCIKQWCYVKWKSGSPACWTKALTKVYLQSLVLFSQQGEKSTKSSTCLVSSLTLIFKPWKGNSFRTRARKFASDLHWIYRAALGKGKPWSSAESLLLSQCIAQPCNLLESKEKENPRGAPRSSVPCGRVHASAFLSGCYSSA